MKIALVKSDSLGDWYTIEKAEHENRHWMASVDIGGYPCMSLMYSGRISDACVEGTAAEMLAIAEAIERREEESFKRCAVDARTDRVEFWSPRNSQRHGIVSREAADELAAQIRRELGSVQSAGAGQSEGSGESK